MVTPPARHVPDVVSVLWGILSRMNTRRDWDHRRSMPPSWARTGFTGRKGQPGFTLTAGTSLTIVIWREADGKWSGWMFKPGYSPNWDDVPGFGIRCSVAAPAAMSEEQAKRSAVTELRSTLVGDAKASIMDAAVLDETFVEHQL